MNGLQVTPDGGQKWTQDAGVGGTTGNPQVPSVGVLKINSGGGVSKPAIWATPPAPTATRWATFRMTPSYAITTAAPAGSFRIVGNVIVKTAGTDYASTAFTFESAGVGLGAARLYHSTTGGLDAAVTADTYPASSMTGKKQGDFWHPWAGDVFQLRKVPAGAVVTYDFYSNGYKIASNAVDIAAAYTAASLALNDSFGVKGDIQSNTPNLFSFFENDDPATAPMLTVKKMGHTAQKKHWDGSNDIYVPLRGEFSLRRPRELYATVVNAATGAVVLGPLSLSDYTTTALVSSVGTWYGNITIPAAITPAVFYVVVERRDVKDGQVRQAFTPNMNAGEIIALTGQSLATQVWQGSSSGITVTPPANSWIADGSIDQGGGGYPGVNTDFRVHHCAANTTPYNNNVSDPTYLLQAIATAAGHSNFTLIRGGYGGTTQISRQPGAGHGIHEALIDGIERVGDVGYIFLDPGTYEMNGAVDVFSSSWATFAYGTDTVTFKGLIDTFVRDVEAFVRHPVRVVIAPPPGIDNTNTATLNQRTNNLARAMFELVQTNGGFGTVTSSNPQRYYQGPFTYDLQHAASDQYHLKHNVDGYAEKARRWGYTGAKVMGYAATDRNGATIDDTTQPSRTSTTLAVTFNLRGATTLSADNTAFASDFRCGMHFYKTGTTTEVLPTAVSVGSPSGGKVAVTWTFASADLTTAIDVTGPAGLSPYNQAQNATIAANMMIDASMLRSTFSDPETTFFGPPMQPYFNAAFLTNNTHDFVTSN